MTTAHHAPRFLLAPCGLLLVLLAACGAPPPPPRRAPPPAPAAKVIEEDEKPKAPANVYVYSPVGKRDPFQNVFAVKDTGKPRPDPGGGRKPTPLQRFPLDRLRLAMTMTGTSSPMAMVEDPDGRGWTIRIGEYIGENWGKVTSIQRDQIVITETITDHGTGRVYPQERFLKVPKDATELASEKQFKDGSLSDTQK